MWLNNSTLPLDVTEYMSTIQIFYTRVAWKENKKYTNLPITVNSNRNKSRNETK